MAVNVTNRAPTALDSSTFTVNGGNAADASTGAVGTVRHMSRPKEIEHRCQPPPGIPSIPAGSAARTVRSAPSVPPTFDNVVGRLASAPCFTGCTAPATSV